MDHLGHKSSKSAMPYIHKYSKTQKAVQDALNSGLHGMVPEPTTTKKHVVDIGVNEKIPNKRQHVLNISVPCVSSFYLAFFRC